MAIHQNLTMKFTVNPFSFQFASDLKGKYAFGSKSNEEGPKIAPARKRLEIKQKNLRGREYLFSLIFTVVVKL